MFSELHYVTAEKETSCLKCVLKEKSFVFTLHRPLIGLHHRPTAVVSKLLGGCEESKEMRGLAYLRLAYI